MFAVRRRCRYGAGIDWCSRARSSPARVSPCSRSQTQFVTTRRTKNAWRSNMAKQNENVVQGLTLGEQSAGAGALGLVGAAAVFVVAIVFFVAESYFLAMLLVSFAML